LAKNTVSPVKIHIFVGRKFTPCLLDQLQGLLAKKKTKKNMVVVAQVNSYNVGCREKQLLLKQIQIN